jgi:hypothetical protein
MNLTRRVLLAAAATGVAIAAAQLSAVPASAAQPPMLHSTQTYPFGDGTYLCGELVLTAEGGSYVENIDAVVVGGIVHYNVVRTYHDLTFSGSDGAEYRASASAHETILITFDTGEPISSREVEELTFFGPAGSPGYLHEVITLSHGVETTLDTGPCQFGPE